MVFIVLQKNIPPGILHCLNQLLVGKVTTWGLNRDANNYTVKGHVSDFRLMGNTNHAFDSLYFPLINDSQNPSIVCN